MAIPQWRDLSREEQQAIAELYTGFTSLLTARNGGLGLPLKVVQHRLGHSTIQMTADVYGHLFPSGDDGSELAAAQKALLG
jgi:integrase